MATKRAKSKSKAKPKAKRATPTAAAIPQPKSVERYELESDLNTLQRAAEIKANKSRMGQIKKLAAAEVAKLKNIAN